MTVIYLNKKMHSYLIISAAMKWENVIEYTKNNIRAFSKSEKLIYFS